MSTTSSLQLEIQAVSHGPLQRVSWAWPTGVSWICGDEGTGKTTLLRLLAGDLQPQTGRVIQPAGGVFWINRQGAEHDHTTVDACWMQLRKAYPNWDDALREDLTHALDMDRHRDKELHMLSTGSRRKVTLVAALASGAAVTLLDQPFSALDAASVHVLKDFLREVATHPARAWLVADYEAPHDVPLSRVLNLDTQAQTRP